MKSITRYVISLLAATSMLASIPLATVTGAGEQDSRLSQALLTEELTSQHLAAPDQAPTIACDETKQGSIDQNDQTFSNGVHYDLYTLTTQQANQPFIFTAQATNFAVDAVLYYFDPQRQQFVFQQEHFTAIQNGQIQFSGVFATAGQYGIVVAADSPQSIGPYTLKYECRACGQAGGNCATGGTIQNPVPIQLNQRLECQLTMNDEPITSGSQAYFGKFFAFDSTGVQVSINVTSTAFTPILLIYNPPGQQPGLYILSEQLPATQQLPAGRLVIGVTSNLNQPPRTGAFTIEITGGGTPPPGGDCSTGGGINNPVAIQIGQMLTCQLSTTDEQLSSGGQTYYGKFFRFSTQGGTHTFTVNSTAFTPQLLIVDPPGSQPGLYTFSGPAQLPEGTYVIGVTSTSPGGTGQFTIQITRS